MYEIHDYTLFRLYLAVVLRNSMNSELLMKTCLKRHFVKHAWALIENDKLFMRTCLKSHFVKHAWAIIKNDKLSMKTCLKSHFVMHK